MRFPFNSADSDNGSRDVQLQGSKHYFITTDVGQQNGPDQVSTPIEWTSDQVVMPREALHTLHIVEGAYKSCCSTVDVSHHHQFRATILCKQMS